MDFVRSQLGMLSTVLIPYFYSIIWIHFYYFYFTIYQFIIIFLIYFYCYSILYLHLIVFLFSILIRLSESIFIILISRFINSLLFLLFIFIVILYYT